MTTEERTLRQLPCPSGLSSCFFRPETKRLRVGKPVVQAGCTDWTHTQRFTPDALVL